MAQKLDLGVPVKYIKSAWGRKLVAVGDHIFRRQKILKEKSYWTCVLERKCSCRARIHVLEDKSEIPTIIHKLGDHNHKPRVGQVEKRFTVEKLKEIALETHEPSSKVIHTVLQEDPASENVFGSKERMKATLRRARRSHRLQKTNEQKSANGTDDDAGADVDKVIIDIDTSAKKPKGVNDIVSSYVTPLQDKVILITGGSSGIGAAIAESLAEAGATVCIAARRHVKLHTIQERIEYNGGVAHSFTLDVTDRNQYMETVETIECHVGPIDVLINNAGVMFYTHMHNAMADDWDQMIDVNCRGVTNGIACVLPRMVQRREGHIVNMTSDAGRRGFPGIAVYSGTKCFVEGLSQALRQEVKDKGIRVTCIQPGDVLTELRQHVKDIDAVDQYDTANAGKILEPEDVARAVVYAMSQPCHVGVNEILIEPREFPI